LAWFDGSGFYWEAESSTKFLASGSDRSTLRIDESEFKATSLAASPLTPPPPSAILKMPTPSQISVFRRFPKELFRVNNGYPVNLRVWTPKRRTYDIVVENGVVQPKALEPSSYIGQSSEK